MSNRIAAARDQGVGQGAISGNFVMQAFRVISFAMRFLIATTVPGLAASGATAADASLGQAGQIDIFCAQPAF
jgi:hypothetical protein